MKHSRAGLAQLKESRLARQRLQLRISREVRTGIADVESAESPAKSLRAGSALHTNQSLLSQAERSASTAALALDLSLGRIDMNRLPNP